MKEEEGSECSGESVVEFKPTTTRSNLVLAGGF
jgi:hypothetical protein